ncbi:MAG: OmpA family protein [Candidatus Kapaibacterium sp.]
MRILATLIVALFIGSLQLHAQDSERPAYGVYGDFALNFHTASFRQLSGIPNCCKEFDSGSGSGFSLGALYQFSLARKLTMQLRGGYQQFSAELITPEATTIFSGGGAADGEFEHHLTATLSTVGVEPILGYRLFGRVNLHAGFRVGMLMSKGFRQYEQITKPVDAATFLDSAGKDSGRRLRNEFSGDIPDAQSLQLSAIIGASMKVPINSSRTLFLAPELFYTLGLTNVARDLSWKANTLQLGIALKYSPAVDGHGEPQNVPPVQMIVDTIRRDSAGYIDMPYKMGIETRTQQLVTMNGKQIKTEVIRRTDTLTVATLLLPSTIRVHMNAVGIETDGREIPSLKITTEEFASTLMTPILPYIFFDENSSVIPDRYTMLTAQTTDQFDSKYIATKGKISTYHTLLNILGERLTEMDRETITLIGCNQDSRSEKGNTELSLQRAKAVKRYLTDVWKIAPARIKVQSQNLPAKAANPATKDGEEENRRVEIVASSERLLEPLIVSDTFRTVNPPAVKFSITTEYNGPLASWQLHTRQADHALKSFDGPGRPPGELLWNLAGDPASVPTTNAPVTAMIEVSTTEHTTTHTSVDIPVERITIQSKRTERRGDKQIDRFSLILFDIRSSDIVGVNRSIIKKIQQYCKPNSSIKVTGYSDRLGEAGYNQQLADSRALAAAKALDVNNIKVEGIGQAELYDSSLPEGRMYTRTVEVVIETPVE